MSPSREHSKEGSSRRSELGRVRGNDYKHRIARYLVTTYGARGVEVYEEVNVGTSIIGKQRRVDLLVVVPRSGVASRPVGAPPASRLDGAQALVVECKYQDSSGTADEKIPYALDDLAALRMPGVICYAGSGFSEGVLHLLQSSRLAAYCQPDDSYAPLPRRSGDAIDSGTWQLDHTLAVTFGFWDILLQGRSPLRFDERGG